MANLLGANIGTNYKGFLNLDSTINTPLDATLRSVTDGMGTNSPLQLSTDQVGILRTIALTAGATNQRLFNNVYTINNSGAQTGTLTGYFLNATVTALNGMTHNLMDLQVNGSSRFAISPTGVFLSPQCNRITLSNNSDYIEGSNNSGLTTLFSNQSIQLLSGSFAYRFASTGIFQLGGATSSFPAIKRNGTAIDFRLANDSGFCGINFAGGAVYGTIQMTLNSIIYEQSNANYLLDLNGLRFGQSKGLTFFSAGANAGSPDAGFYRSSASTLRVSNGTTGYGILEIGNTVTSAVAVASTHKVTINIGGVTYYLLASNV
jgi:hypothetical protein